MECLAGSHRWDVLHCQIFADGRESMMVHPECPKTHGASGNASPTMRRIGLSNRYLGSDVQWDPRPGAPRYRLDPKIQPDDYPADDLWFPVCCETRASGG